MSDETVDQGRAGPIARSVERVPTVLGVPLADRLFLFGVLPLLALVVGAVLPAVARWALSLGFVLPLRPVLRFFAAINDPWEIALHLAVWLFAGFAVGLVGLGEEVTVAVADDELQVTRDDRTRTVARRDISAVFGDGKALVVLDRCSRELIRDTPATPLAAVADAFRDHDYPWRDADPYASSYHRWTLGAADLPAAAHAVLTAREKALRRQTDADPDDLRDDLQHLGFAVRDERSTQFWRRLEKA